jgi:hypothetical protein
MKGFLFCKPEIGAAIEFPFSKCRLSADDGTQADAIVKVTIWVIAAQNCTKVQFDGVEAACYD